MAESHLLEVLESKFDPQNSDNTNSIEMFLVSTGESKEAYFLVLPFLQNCLIFPSITLSWMLWAVGTEALAQAD